MRGDVSVCCAHEGETGTDVCTSLGRTENSFIILPRGSGPYYLLLLDYSATHTGSLGHGKVHIQLFPMPFFLVALNLHFSHVADRLIFTCFC